MESITVRTAGPKDMGRVLELIKELAEYENEPDAVLNTEEQLVEDGFGTNKVFDCFVAVNNDIIVGFALFYTGYSTWNGKTLYLEDFIVEEASRGLGAGRALFDAVVQEAKKRKVRRMDWQVLEWNELAIEFYKKNDALLDAEWLNGRLFFK